jgi:pimeloyl-ACP methyl ester carboxylesterase
MKSAMKTFVMVPGGWHGGWYFQGLAAQLRAAGHAAVPVTLTGVGDRAHLATAATNLDTHIQDVLAVLAAERITNAVLVGHSYGGMVVTGVADRVPELVEGLIYCDAYVPADGESCWDLAGDAFREVFLEGAAADGYSVRPRVGLDPRATAHPLASFLQRITLTRGLPDVRRDYVYLSGWEGTPFTSLYERLREDPTWRVHQIDTRHDVMAEEGERLLRILLNSIAPQERP